MDNLVQALKSARKKIAVMESCTGGGVCNALTNVSGASEVFEFGAVTYANESKVRLGVSRDIIERYTVYSDETAREMSRAVREYAGADIGVGVTGKLRRADACNQSGADDVVYISVYDGARYMTEAIRVTHDTRADNKAQVIDEVVALALSILDK